MDITVTPTITARQIGGVHRTTIVAATVRMRWPHGSREFAEIGFGRTGADAQFDLSYERAVILRDGLAKVIAAMEAEDEAECAAVPALVRVEGLAP
jgi:hypothetical protein